MSRAHRNRLQKQKSFSSRFCLKEEMSFSLQKSPPCVVGPKEWPAPPEWLAGRADPTSLPKDFNFLSLVEQQASKAKGPENNLYAQYEERVRPCIDLIDSLRALGVEQDLALPAIAVIGDQSSGKSSVLEALSGVPLPRGNGIITRCPLELKMKKQPWASRWRATVSYRDVRLQLDSPSQVEKEIRKAQKALTGSDTSISQELITLEVTSCEVPDLTLIDLPGIARLAIGGQPRDIGEQIKALIRKYIQRQETINLVVVPSNVDIATTEALSMAREVDPDGDRTIGVLTKPDLVDRGTEKGVLQVAQNLTYHLKKGYMMVRCRAQQEVLNNLSCAEAAKREMQFFEVHPHFRVLLDNGMATVPRLAERLTEELSEHISKSLPLLETQIREKHLQATEELRSCGADVPSQEADMMFFLIEKIKLFNQDIEKLVEAEEAVKEKETRMYNRVRQQFQRWAGVLTASNLRVKNNIQDEISKYENQYRGKELLGFVSYKTFETIVQQHLQQLVDPALQVLLSAVEIVQQAFCDTAAKHFSDFSNLHQIVRNNIEGIRTRQVEKAQEVIQLQFKMEKLVYCQDQIYSTVLKGVRQEALQPPGNTPLAFPLASRSAKDTAQVSTVSEIGAHVEAYCLETSKRLSNQIPFIIQFFILRENGDCLQKAMLRTLQEKERYSWLLQEHKETATKRKALKERLFRLAQARRTLWQFSKGGVH
ncbi:interferon-induced GTP-binding protein Mx2 isoform X2 [Oryctolagus cuniculus]|uniref:interferon-induced GTP-binding protein Mx2 isoform X2 n=1 Tax=Oryctolagus cuniculus TaxID=9986 RepID=UPI00048FA582